METIAILPDITVYKSADEAYERIHREGGFKLLREGICPECNEELELVEEICVEVSPQNYWREQEYDEIGYVYRCPECGEQFITSKEI